jgi:hypothetical protein
MIALHVKGNQMKVKKILRKMHEAIFKRDEKEEKRLWFKALKKSLQHKKTHSIK